jgi:hypothetical protein
MRKLFIVSILLMFSFVSCEDTSAQSLTAKCQQITKQRRLPDFGQ